MKWMSELLAIVVLVGTVTTFATEPRRRSEKPTPECQQTLPGAAQLNFSDIHPDTYTVDIDRARAAKEKMKKLLQTSLPKNLQKNAVGLFRFGKGFTVEVRCQDPIPMGYARLFPTVIDGVMVRTRYTGRIAVIPGYVGDLLFIQQAAESFEMDLRAANLSDVQVEIEHPGEAFMADVMNGNMDADDLKEKYPQGFVLRLKTDGGLPFNAPDLVRLPVYFFRGFPVRVER